MKLSEAIREGCKYGPQIIKSRHDDKGGSCALGAAENGHRGRPITTDESWEFGNNATDIWPWLKTHFIRSGPPGFDSDDFGYFNGQGWRMDWVIANLNNSGMSREAVAEFVETVERKLGLWNDPTPTEEAERTAEVEAQYAADSIHGRPIEID